MKAYVASTGALFGLVATAHLLRTFTERSRLSEDPWFLLGGPGLGIFPRLRRLGVAATPAGSTQGGD